ncbi:MAG: error-prone DNA polymerase [Phycisphaerae bacterium]
MPESEHLKIRKELELQGERAPEGPYVELQVTSNFSFLRGGSHPQELVKQAQHMGCRGVAITDINTMAGIVRGYAEAEEIGMRYIVGCHVQAKHAGEIISVLVYPADKAGYGRLCRMLTQGKRRAEKGECELTLEEVLEHAEGNVAIAVPPVVVEEKYVEVLRRLREAFDRDRLSLAASCVYDGQDRARLAELAKLSRSLRIPLVATNDVHYHDAGRRELQDVVTCIRKGCTIEQAGFDLFANAERHIKGPAEMMRLFREHPRAIERTVEIAERVSGFSLEQLKYNYPSEICPAGKTMMQHLVDRTWEGARERYPNGVPADVERRLREEFKLIEELNYPAYFLTVDDIVGFARSKNILCQGRGAAANSAVCYCLGVTAVDPAAIDLLVERFMSKERDEPPDIDIDFEHERREEVIQYLYGKYGRERAALTAEVICYRRRSAIREVGKALGLSLDCVDRLAKDGDWWDSGIIDEARLRSHGLDPHDPTIYKAIALAGELMGFPRHLSQHVGGFVLSECPLCEIVPIENASMPDRTVIEWDKDDIDEMGMMKVDVLGLGMLTAVRKAIDLVNEWDRRNGGGGEVQFHTIPDDDPAVYDMLCRADSVGVFQVESRAQMSMLPRLRPRCYYDLVVEVAIVRPGPIQGGMVHPYLRRRNSEEAIEYPDDKIKAVLERTLGVPIFQEQAMRLVMVAAGFTAGEADKLRRAMASWKKKGDALAKFGEKIVAGMLKNGYTPAYAERVVGQIRGFGEYGFPESHSASFALIVCVSAWLKCHHPAAFTAALINSQPMGFYAPAQLVRDAREHGVQVQAIDVNHSQWDCTLERGGGVTMGPALRLGMRLVGGLREVEAQQIAAAVRERGKFRSVISLWRASGVRVATLRTLAHADAFRSMGLDRQAALWEIRQLRDQAMPMFEAVEEPAVAEGLPAIAPYQMVVHDYAATGLSLKAHPISFVRKTLDSLGVARCSELNDERVWKNGMKIGVSGLVLVRQKPGTSKVIFVTIEDESGVANLIVRPEVYQQFRRELRHSVSVIIWGKVERLGQVVHVMVEKAESLADRMRSTRQVATRPRNFH